MSKVDASKATLSEINPDVEIEAHTYNITSTTHFDHFLDRLKHGGRSALSTVAAEANRLAYVRSSLFAVEPQRLSCILTVSLVRSLGFRSIN